MSGARLCILGSINMDLIVRAPRLPAPGETILGGPFETLPGGKGANQAVGAARAHAAVRMVGAVGDDAYGRMMVATLREEGVDVSRVGVRTGTPTGVALISVGESGENTIIVAPGANSALTPEDAGAARDSIGAADLLLAQLEVPLETVIAAATIAKEADTAVVLNAAPARALPNDLLALVDVLVVNETEGAIVAGGSGSMEVIGESLARRGMWTVVVTLGGEGVWFHHEGASGRLPAHRVEPIDTVGAGDAFCGVLAARWAEHRIGGGLDEAGVRDALWWASAAGALATTKRGAIPSLPRREEIVGLLRAASL